MTKLRTSTKRVGNTTIVTIEERGKGSARKRRPVGVAMVDILTPLLIVAMAIAILAGWELLR